MECRKGIGDSTGPAGCGANEGCRASARIGRERPKVIDQRSAVRAPARLSRGRGGAPMPAADNGFGKTVPPAVHLVNPQDLLLREYQGQTLYRVEAAYQDVKPGSALELVFTR